MLAEGFNLRLHHLERGTVVTTHEASQYKGYVTSKEIGATYTGW